MTRSIAQVWGNLRLWLCIFAQASTAVTYYLHCSALQYLYLGFKDLYMNWTGLALHCTCTALYLQYTVPALYCTFTTLYLHSNVPSLYCTITLLYLHCTVPVLQYFMYTCTGLPFTQIALLHYLYCTSTLIHTLYLLTDWVHQLWYVPAPAPGTFTRCHTSSGCKVLQCTTQASAT